MRCPNGTKKNKKTGVCEKHNTKRKKCPNGKVRNPKTNRCVTRKLKSSKQMIPKSIKQITPKPKQCPEGKELNPKTNRCRKITITNILDEKKVNQSLKTPTYEHSITSVMKQYKKKSNKNIFPYICNNVIQKLMLVHLLKTNKNGCAYDINKYGLFKASNNKIYYYMKGKKTKYSKFAKHIISRYKDCAKKRKMLIVPFTVDNDTHSNIIIFNPFRNEAERFEPHGTETQIQGFNNTNINAELKAFIDELKLGIKFVPSHKTCPSGFRAYQQYDTQKRASQMFYNLAKIRDPGGYCCAWSFFYADLRLKYPRLSGAEIIQKSIKMIGNNPKQFRHFIHGQVEYLFKMIESINQNHVFLDYLMFIDSEKKEVDVNRQMKFDKMFSEWEQYVEKEMKMYF